MTTKQIFAAITLASLAAPAAPASSLTAAPAALAAARTRARRLILLAVLAAVVLAVAIVAIVATPVADDTPAEAGAGLALAAVAAAAVPRKRRSTRFTLIASSGYCVDEVRPSCDVREDDHAAFADESGEEYLQRLVHIVDEDGDSDPEMLFGMLWHLQYDLGIAWGTKAYEDGYFKYQTRAYELTQISDNEYMLEYVVDGELLLGGDGSDEYYHAVCKIVIDGNRLTLYEYPSDPDDKYVILEVE